MSEDANVNRANKNISNTDLEIKNKEADDYDALIKRLVKVVKNLKDVDNVAYKKHYFMYSPEKTRCCKCTSTTYDIQTPFIDKYSVFQCLYEKLFK